MERSSPPRTPRVRPIVKLRDLSQKLSEQIRDLLQTKHLYQKIHVASFDDPAKPLIEIDGGRNLDFARFTAALWVMKTNSQARFDMEDGRVVVIVPDAKLFCARCCRTEAFNALEVESLVNRSSVSESSDAGTVQVFAIIMQCQSCKEVPEVLLVRREGRSLYLCGRAPIERVDIPSIVPPRVRSFYRDGVVAFHSGQVLAALFLMRTLVEQWAKPWAPADKRASDAVEAYSATLPAHFAERFPSFRDLYCSLSEALHAARADPVLFKKAQSDILEHFDARRVFRLTDWTDADIQGEAREPERPTDE